jgi:hypothetical protein
MKPAAGRVRLFGVFFRVALEWFFQDELHWIEAKSPVSGESRSIARERMDTEPSGSLIFQMVFNGPEKLQGNVLAAPTVQYEDIGNIAVRGQLRKIQRILIQRHPTGDETGDIGANPGNEDGTGALFRGMDQIIDMFRRDPVARLPRLMQVALEIFQLAHKVGQPFPVTCASR